ncbi:MAG: hypothetical protein P1U87_13075 [Verrucomicrobiales bacterium]|nr:hypothetical protein [Verrucomicrobiales bacterium]
MNQLRQALNRHFHAVLGGLFLALILLGWWNSSRYSERHLHYVGSRSFEVFSASSLIRISFANGHIGSPGRQSGYRQRNARGQFVVRPVGPTFRSGGGLWEITFGYWHLAALGMIGVAVGMVLDRRRTKRER